LPWSLLFDAKPAAAASESLLPVFWGARFNIEQQLEGGRVDPEPSFSGPLRTAFMLWKQFKNAPDQRKFWTDLETRSAGRLTLTDPITSARAFAEQVATEVFHVLYFYTHGYTRSRNEDVASTLSLDRLPQLLETLPAAAPARVGLGALLKRIRDERLANEDSYIELSIGRLYLGDLNQELVWLPGGPLVFLNMCESAQLTPSLSESFIQLFLDRGAPTVVGTECIMTVDFAHLFASSFFEAFFSGKSAGAALFEARRRFLAKGNPLALAYTLFGSASLCYKPPCLPTES
jgi:hypothetical protein